MSNRLLIVRTLIFAATLAGFGAAGCSSGSPHFVVKGKVVDGDKSILPDPNEKNAIHILFVQQRDDGKPPEMYSSSLNREDGTFELKGHDDSGVIPGKYRVKFNSVMPDAKAVTSRLLMQKFSTDTSPILVDIVDGKTPLAIDIGPHKNK